MFSNHSVFNKIFLTNALLLLVTVALIAGIFSVTVNRYYANEFKDQLQLANALTSQLLESNYTGGMPRGVLIDSLETVANLYNVSIVAADSEGNIFLDLAAEGQQRTEYGKQGEMDGRILQTVSDAGQLYVTGTINNFYRSRSAIYIEAVQLSAAEQIYVFTASNMASATAMINELVRTLILLSIVILLCVFLLNFWITKRIVRPLVELRDTARCYARGDFAKRVEVYGKNEVSELADAFNKMADHLADTEKTRTEFIGNVSHELKTPMTTITGFADGMLDGTIPPERYTEYLTSISTESKRLSRLVNQLLITSRIDADRQEINIGCVNICDVIGRCALSLEKRIEEKKLDVDIRFCEEQVFVQADPDAIVQVMYNLIDNAQKYADEGGTLRISVEKKNDKAEIAVYNTGVGIRREDLPHIFDRFYKADKSRSLSKSSYGLGLYIVKSLINRHGEDVFVRSIPGEFAEFSFCLKLDTRRAQPVAEIEIEPYDLKEDPKHGE